jgi:hypothetical protein
MLWKNVQNLKNEDFKRLSGVHRKTFDKMMEILNEAEKIKKKRGGKPSKLCLQDELLMTLEYLREYRTFFHVSKSWGISESTCHRKVVWIEDILVKSNEFSLPKRKELLEENEFEVILVDATETPIERPKRHQKKFTQAHAVRRSQTRKNTR